MANRTQQLVIIETDSLYLELRGPQSSAKTNAVLAPPHFSVEGDESIRVRVLDDSGALRDWSSGETGPRLFEASQYTLIAIGASDLPAVRHRDPVLLRDLTSLPTRRTVSGTINFRQQVGRTRLEVACGATTVALELEVFPTKLDYATDYRDLLADLQGVCRALVFENLRSTSISGSSVDALGTERIEWLLLLRGVVQRLERAIDFIDARPMRTLRPMECHVRLDQLRRVDSVARSALRRGTGRGGWTNLPGSGPARERIPSRPSRDTLDTPEHRWIRQQLDAARAHLFDLERLLALAVSDTTDGREPSARAIAELAEIRDLRVRIERALDAECIAEARPTSGAQHPSLTLMAAPGYADAYQCLTALRRGIVVDGDALRASTKDLDALYEAWCFTRLAQLLASQLGAPDLGTAISTDAAGIRVRIRRGHRSEIRFKSGQTEVRLHYNYEFAGLTGTQRPDILLTLMRPGAPLVQFVIDAKYRLDVSDDYLSVFGCAGPPVDAVNALHRYRDAIALGPSDAPDSRNVVQAVALFPLSTEATSKFAGSRLHRSIGVIGVGALPFLPGNTHLVEQWLKATLEAPLTTLLRSAPAHVSSFNVSLLPSLTS